jgi:hypothetical protein
LAHRSNPRAVHPDKAKLLHQILRTPDLKLKIINGFKDLADKNQQLFDKWNLDGFPCLILTDAQGRPYGNLRAMAGVKRLARTVPYRHRSF